MPCVSAIVYVGVRFWMQRAALATSGHIWARRCPDTSIVLTLPRMV